MKTGQHILIVEDEPKIRDGLRDFLEFHEFRVECVDDGLAAERRVAEHRFDLILLDLMLPHISGEQLCLKWRQAGLRMPILMLTAKGQEKEKIAGLDLGADDYITKPFSLEELLARIRAVLRRTDPNRSVGQTFAFGPFAVDMERLTLRYNDDTAALTRRQAMMLQLFAANPGRIVTRQELYESAWNESLEGIETRTIDMHIARLRDLLEQAGGKTDLIQTVRGEGYRYDVS
ncbi:MAG TPA: response regulator transcription factor [Phycisphaerales bacterium]|nr:response regulator transcription factor [Phycisphaerales bacterium]